MPMTIMPTTDHDALPRRSALIGLCLAYALLTLVPVLREPITRVQEARVLETARQMTLAPHWHDWVVPQLNGEPRLRKPPLAYWMAAGSFEVFGTVREWAGRLPTLIVTWLIVVVTSLFGRDLGGRRFAFFAAAIVASETMFVRFTRSAETDLPAMLGVLIAVRAFARATYGERPLRQFHVAALGIALAAMSKGAPALFAVAFLLFLAIAERSWRPIVAFGKSGAWLTALALIVPWYAYVIATSPAGDQVGREVGVVLSGSNHFGLFYEYATPLLAGVLPWSGWSLLAVVAAWQTRKTADRARRIVLCAVACVALPLSITLNVQRHYLLPIVPMVALLVAWFLVRLTERSADASTIDPRLAQASRVVLGVAVTLVAVAAPAAIVASVITRHRVVWPAIVASVAFGVAATWLIVRYRDAEPRRQLVAFAVAMVVVMPVETGWWEPSLKVEPLPTLAPAALAALRSTLGGEPGPFLQRGPLPDVALGYYLRRPMPSTTDDAAIDAFLAANPRGVVVAERSRKRAAALPTRFGELELVHAGPASEDDTAEFYVARR